MLKSIFATKGTMTQAWTTSSKRLAVTRLVVNPNLVIRQLDENKFQIGYGPKKLKNVKKPAREQIKKAGFSFGVKQLKQAEVTDEGREQVKIGQKILVENVLNEGDMIKVQGRTKGKGFAGGMKRHGYKGGPATHGQSDRKRAVGSIGSGTYPGKVWKGKGMPGHMGDEIKSAIGLVVLHVDSENNEVWVSGPVPGSLNSIVKIIKTGKTKKIELDKRASGIPEEAPEQTNDQSEEAQKDVKTKSEEVKEEVKETKNEKSTEKKVNKK